MSRSTPKNMAASVHRRLLNLAPEFRITFNELSQRYALERFLYRLSQSEHADEFMLKGAMLFAVWEDQPHRPTRDIDLLGFGEDSEDRLRQVFANVCETSVAPDGLIFDADTVVVGEIREGEEYQGKRVVVKGQLGNARVQVQVDVGFGDDLAKWGEVIDYPTLLDLPAPRLRAYPVESVIAEKVHAMAQHGMANSRMKDLFDIYTLAERLEFCGEELVAAISATFGRRGSVTLTVGLAPLHPSFAEDQTRLARWSAFLTRNRLDSLELHDVCRALGAFLLQPIGAVVDGSAFPMKWPAGGPWAPLDTPER